MHFVDDCSELVSIVDPLAIEGSLFWGKKPGDALALFLPGELMVGPVQFLWITGAWALRVATGHPPLDETTTANEAHLAHPFLHFTVLLCVRL